MCVNLCRQLSYVKERCEGEPEGDGVAALTSEERTRWAKVRGTRFGDVSGMKRSEKILTVNAVCLLSPQAREHLISIDPHNKTILETIQSSLFVISLDETKPYSTPENYTNVLATHMNY